jgi:hypothetical protein
MKSTGRELMIEPKSNGDAQKASCDHLADLLNEASGAQARPNSEKAGAPTAETSTCPMDVPPALNDSPIVLAVWIVEKFWQWSDCDGDIERRFSEDELLTRAMIYWLTEMIGSSFQPYNDYMKADAMRWDGRRQGLDGFRQNPGGRRALPGVRLKAVARVERALLFGVPVD